MDRKQKIDRIANRGGKVSKVSNLDVRWTLLHPDYGVVHLDGSLSETGKLEVLKVVPISGKGPYFVGRWDQGAEHLDVDMHGASNTAIGKFKAHIDGYSGHHTSRTGDPDRRIVDVTIRIPTSVVFDGTVSFSNTYDQTIKMQSSSNVSVTANVIRANQKP